MDQVIKEAWLDALESGDYVQGTGVLHRKDDRFCCLGVLCDLAFRAGIATRDMDGEDDGDAYTYGPVDVPYSASSVLSWNWSRSALPTVVANWAGLTDGNPVTNLGSLASINDGLIEVGDNSFDGIAQIIREQL